MQSAAGIAAAAAAMQSSSSMPTSSQSPPTSLPKDQKIKAQKETSGSSMSTEETSESKDTSSDTHPDSSSNVVSSTINEDELSRDYEETEYSKKNAGKLKKGRQKVIFEPLPVFCISKKSLYLERGIVKF